jgi:hypothetical protein
MPVASGDEVLRYAQDDVNQRILSAHSVYFFACACWSA